MRMLSSFTAMLAAAPAPAIPRTVKTADNVYTYEDYHAGDEQFTTTNMFVVMDGGVLVADRPRKSGGDQRADRCDCEGRAPANQVRRRLLRSRRSHGRQCLVSIRHHVR